MEVIRDCFKNWRNHTPGSPYLTASDLLVVNLQMSKVTVLHTALMVQSRGMLKKFSALRINNDSTAV